MSDLSGPYVDMTPFGHCGPCRECASPLVCRRLRDQPGDAQYYYHCVDCRAEWVTPTEAQLAGQAWVDERIKAYEERSRR